MSTKVVFLRLPVADAAVLYVTRSPGGKVPLNLEPNDHVQVAAGTHTHMYNVHGFERNGDGHVNIKSVLQGRYGIIPVPIPRETHGVTLVGRQSGHTRDS